MKLPNLRHVAAVVLLAASGGGAMLVSHARPKPAAAGYHLLKTVSLPPAPGGAEYFDYITVDAPARRVYVSHGTEVVVLNADDYSVVGRISGLLRCHGIAVVHELGKGFITDGDAADASAQKVVVFDLKTLKVTGEIKTGQPDTDSLTYEPVSKRIFTFNGDSGNTTVIDAVKQTRNQESASGRQGGVSRGGRQRNDLREQRGDRGGAGH
jgi:DNA-binding beta-propeller fold protein YncE